MGIQQPAPASAYPRQFTAVTWRFIIFALLLSAGLLYVLAILGSPLTVHVGIVILFSFITCLSINRAMGVAMAIFTVVFSGCIFVVAQPGHMMHHKLYGSCGPPEFWSISRGTMRAFDEYESTHGTYPLSYDEVNAAGLLFPPNPLLMERYRREGTADNPVLRDIETGEVVETDNPDMFLQIKPIPAGLDSLDLNFQYIPVITVAEDGTAVCDSYELVFFGRKFNYLSSRFECVELFRCASDNR